MDSKVITILGVGGHGSSAYRDLVTNPAYNQYKINLILGADDCGGHTGELQKILPLMGLGIDGNSVIPMGDLRANIERFVFDLEGNNDLAKQKLDQMSGAYTGNSIDEFIAYCIEFCRVFNIYNDQLVENFLGFSRKYFRVYQLTEGLKNKHKIGNLFLTFLFYYSGFNHEAFFSYLKELGFIPPRVFPHFIYSERLNLKGANLDLGIEFSSEAEIDEAKVPISPSTYTLVKSSNGEPLTIEDLEQSHPVVISAIRESGLIVMSTGSVANLFGQLNVLAPELRSNPALKIWLGNIATTNNEVNFTVLLTYYYSPERLGLDGVALQMSELEFDNITINAEDSTWVERYRKQGKTFVNIADLLGNVRQVFNYNGMAKTVNLVQPVLGITVAGNDIATRIPGWESLTNEEKEIYKAMLEQAGIKYVTTEVTLFLRFFYELNYYLSYELQIFERSKRYSIIATLLQELRMSEKEDPSEIALYTEILSKRIQTIDEVKVKTERFLACIKEYNPNSKVEVLSELLIPFESEDITELELRVS